MHPPTIGLDIGGTKVLGVVVDTEGVVVRELRQASPHAGVDALVATSSAIVEALGSADEPIGVGVAGLVDTRGHVLYSPNLPYVRQAPLRDALVDATGHRVVVDNDANVATLGEATYGAARGVRHALLVTLGTGIGGGMLLDGRMYRGAHNFGAEFGHFTVDVDGPMCVCGERGHWEAIASGSALGRMARELVSRGGGPSIVAAAGGDRDAVTGIAVGTAAANGDGDALGIARALRRQRRARSGRTREHSRSRADRDRGWARRAGHFALRPVARRVPPAHRRFALPATDRDRARRARRARRCGRRGRARARSPAVINVGLTLPSFVEDPEIAITVARAAEDAHLDGVFVYDHLWRGDLANRRPALECFGMLGAVAAETTQVKVGTLVARATLRPPATLAQAFATADRISGGRVIAGIGAGDTQSRAENEAFGLEFGTMVDRINALHDAVRSTRGNGFPVWVGGRAAQVREVVTVADGWNAWGAEPEPFAAQVALVREVAPDAVITWGGLARPTEEGVDGLTARLRAYMACGTEWLIVGPIDSSNPGNATLLGEVRERLREQQ